MKLKLTVVLIAIAVFVFAAGTSRRTFAQKTENAKQTPAELLVKLDAIAQNRFLTEPYFGIRRIAPVGPTNPHLEFFNVKNAEEQEFINLLDAQGWKVIAHLFGRNIMPRTESSSRAQAFDINYRIFNPIVVTPQPNWRNVPLSQTVLKEAKQAFIDLQKTTATPEGYFYDRGWQYFIRPVRASESKCIECHRDYVITEKLKDGQYKFRPRQVGDVNGILIYGFKRK